MTPLGFLSQYDVILGSSSPRRQELLRGMQIEFRIVESLVEERYPDNLPVEEVPIFLSELKAKDIQNQLSVHNYLLITADTVVIHNGQILGKPQSLKEAGDVLKELSGDTHSVITGVTISTNHLFYSFSDTTLVTIAPISDDEIDFTLDKDQVLDKAGSYGIQDWFGLAKVSSLVGSFYNVMGLPTHKLYKVLRELSIS